MKRFPLLTLFLLTFATIYSAPLVLTKNNSKELLITNKESHEVRDYPVTIKLHGDAQSLKWVVRGDDYRIIPFQLDDYDGDKRPDELFFLVNLRPNQKVTLTIIQEDARRQTFHRRTHAQMYQKIDKTQITAINEYATTKDDAYNKLHHHGPAFESELAAYRIYFDKKQTIDIYGKKKYQLELLEAKWYPTDEQLKKGFGDDVLIVRGALGLGTLRGWNGTESCHFDKMDERRMTVRSFGPLRSIVELSLKGWEINGQKHNLLSYYIINAGARIVEVKHNLTNVTSKTPTFLCTGVQRMPEEGFFSKKGLMGVWGRDWPVNDTIKYAKETVGLSVMVPTKYIEKETEDKNNYLYLLKPDRKGNMSYRFAFYSQKEPLQHTTPEEFFQWLPGIYETAKVKVKFQ